MGVTPDASVGRPNGERGNDAASYPVSPCITSENRWSVDFNPDFAEAFEAKYGKYESSENEDFTGEGDEDLSQCPVDSDNSLGTNRDNPDGQENIDHDANKGGHPNTVEGNRHQPPECTSRFVGEGFKDDYPKAALQFLTKHFQQVEPDGSDSKGIINSGAKPLGNVDTTLCTGSKWLDQTADRDDINTLKALIREVGVDAVAGDGRTALHAAAESGSSFAIQFLLKAGADPDHRTRDGSTALHLAAMNGCIDCVKLLQAGKAEYDAINKEGKTPLHIAIKNGHDDIAACLMEAGADVNVQATNGWTALHHAIPRGYCYAVELLLKHKAKFNVQNKLGKTPLLIAAMLGFNDIINILIDAGANPNIPDQFGHTPLYYVTSGGSYHLNMMRKLIANGADVNVQDIEGWTLLHVAIWYHDIVTVDLFLEHNIQLDLKDDDGNTPLLMAVMSGVDDDIAKCLIEAGANPNYPNKKGVTALIHAYHNRKLDILKLLIENGAHDTENGPFLIKELSH